MNKLNVNFEILFLRCMTWEKARLQNFFCSSVAMVWNFMNYLRVLETKIVVGREATHRHRI